MGTHDGDKPFHGPPPSTQAIGTGIQVGCIGPYKILEVLGEGGMGTVYLAEQTEPVRRRVALKVIKPGMDSKAVIAQFEAEKQVLALMDHSNVAKVFDAGTTEKGVPTLRWSTCRACPLPSTATGSG